MGVTVTIPPKDTRRVIDKVNVISYILKVLKQYFVSKARRKIVGSMVIGGSWNVVDNGFGVSEGVDWNCLVTCGGSVNLFPPPKGDFLPIAGNSTGVSGGLTLPNWLYTDLPKVILEADEGAVHYEMLALTTGVVSGDVNPFTNLIISGTGVMSIEGYNDTPCTWELNKTAATFTVTVR